MSGYTISCTACGSFEQGVAYRGERISHTHTWTGVSPTAVVRITVTS